MPSRPSGFDCARAVPGDRRMGNWGMAGEDDMKQRTRNILKAAEAALASHACRELWNAHEDRLEAEFANWIYMLQVPKEQRALFLCFCAAMNETGDLP